MSFSTPVVLIIYRRPQHTQQVFDQIARIKPEQLFVIADGAHPDRPEEVSLCQQTRDIINQVDWQCDVHTNYAESNMGLADRVASGISWVFEYVERAIILEDDCVPHLTFFRYCETLLEKYATNPQIMSIGGFNALHSWGSFFPPSYFFTKTSYIWGWATWKRAWKHYNHEITHNPNYVDHESLRSYLENDLYNYLYRMFELDAAGEIDTWDIRWVYSCLLNEGLCIVPAVNLVSNVGYGDLAANTTGSHMFVMNLESCEMKFPLKHPRVIRPDHQYERQNMLLFQHRLREQSIWVRLKRRLWRFLKDHNWRTY